MSAATPPAVVVINVRGMTGPAHRATAVATHLLAHPELADRSLPYVGAGEVDWRSLWTLPPWSTREERVVRAAADLAGAAHTHGIEPVTLAELATPGLWDPAPYSRGGEDHSHRVLEALAMRRGMSESAARVWLAARYDAIARLLDVWDWGALPTDVDAPRHILTSRRMAAKAQDHLFTRSWPRSFESLDTVVWAPAEKILLEAARALASGEGGPTLGELALGLDDEQVATVVEGVYIAWQHDDR